MRGTLNQNACMLFDALHHDIFSFLCKTCKIIKKKVTILHHSIESIPLVQYKEEKEG